MSNIDMNTEFVNAIAAIETGESVYITGPAGTGKSTLLRHVCDGTSKNHAVLAPTGVAALNVGGQTIHSFFKFQPTFVEPTTVRGSESELFQRLQMLIVDEVSMVRADLMDGMDIFLRNSRGNDAPFGGVQVLMFGDLYQLPPVVDSSELQLHLVENYGGCYFFHAHVFRQFKPMRITLVKNYRQRDEQFLRLLWKVRTGHTTSLDLAALNARRVPISVWDESYVHLTPTKRAAYERNRRFLDRLNAPLHTYQAIVQGNFPASLYPTDEPLQLKVGAKVMMVKNDRWGRWVNGTIGRIANAAADFISVEIDGNRYGVGIETWERYAYVYNRAERRVIQQVVGSFEQYPMRLAYALTVHKAQGITLQKVCIDLERGSFAHGQTYVALSRCTTVEGIVLKRPITRHDIIVDPVVADYEDAAQEIKPEIIAVGEGQ